MRVESKPAAQQEMVKKKHRLKKQQKDANEFPDSSDEGGAEGPFCHHVTKAVNFNLVKKAIKNHGITGECMNCKSEPSSERTKYSDQDNKEVSESTEDCNEPTIWLCLQCGNQGCDRNSKHKHALKHFETPRTGSHDVCVNLTTCVIWCYTCDNEVLLEASKKLAECIEFVKKQVGVGPSQQPSTGKKGSQHRSTPEVPTEEASQEKDSKEDQQKVQNQNKSKTGTSQTLGLPKVKGLSNLGNTCFFNAVMQSMSQTPLLTTILNEHVQKGTQIQLAARQLSCDTDSDEGAHNSGEDEKEPKLLELTTMSITLGDGGVLTGSMLSFMKDMHNSTSKGPVVTPSTLFGQVCKKAPRFKGFQQQDSHELLRCLLDGMKAEEIKRSQAGILSAFSLPTNINNRQVDEETKAQVKVYGTQAKHTFIDSIFGGMFISTVQCEECSMPSQIFEPFLDVSLPVTEEKVIRPTNLGRKKSEKVNTIEQGTNEISYKVSKPSKHTTKKERKKARKEKKRKKKNSESKDTTTEAAAETGQGEPGKDDDDENEEVSGEDEEECSQAKDQPDEPTNQDSAATNNFVIDSTYHHTAEMDDGSKVGLSLEDLKYKDQGRDEDTDSNKAIGTNSEGNLSELDADVEDNDGNRNSPVDHTLKDSKECLCDNSEKVTETKGTSVELLENNDPICNGLEKDRTNQNKVEINRQIHKSGCNTNSICSDTINSNSSNGVKSEEIADTSAFKDCKPMNGVINEITESLKHISIAPDKNDEEIANINDKKLIANIDGLENIHKTTVGSKNIQNSSRPNTPNSPKLSRSSSLRMSNNTKSKHQLQIEARQEAMKVLAPLRYQPDSHECSVQSCLNQFTAAELLTGSNKFGCEFCTKKKKKGTDKDGKKDLVYTNASKQLLIFSPPAVLTLHLKRFQQVGYSLRKVNRHVDFPLVLDLAPYCSALSQGVKSNQSKVLYSLYGIVEHSGRLTGGHYTAYVKVRPNSNHNVKAFIQHNSLHGLTLDKVLVESLDAMRMGEGAVGGVQEDEQAASPMGKWYYISDSRVSETNESNVLRCQAYLLFYERIY